MPNPPVSSHSTMGFDFGLNDPDSCLMRKFRWMFFLEGVSGDVSGIKALPPSRSARPSFNFKEQMVAHLVENIYYPIRAEWKPINLTLFEVKHPKRILSRQNPIYCWLKQVYNPAKGEWFPISRGDSCHIDRQVRCFKRNATLVMYDGCGQVLEAWLFHNAYPQNIEWGDLDMSSSDIVTVDITLRYDRAVLLTDLCDDGDESGSGPGSGNNSVNGSSAFSNPTGSLADGTFSGGSGVDITAGGTTPFANFNL